MNTDNQLTDNFLNVICQQHFIFSLYHLSDI